MEHDEEYIPELLTSDPSTTSAQPVTSDAALRRELAFHKKESERKDAIMQRHGLLPAVPVAPVAPISVPVPSPAIDPRAVAHEVTGAVHNELDSLRLEMTELKQGQSDILKHLQHAGGYEVSPAGNPVFKVGPPTGAGTPPTSKSGTPASDPDDEVVYVPSSQTSKGRALTKSPGRTMTRREAEEKRYHYRKPTPEELQR